MCTQLLQRSPEERAYSKCATGSEYRNPLTVDVIRKRDRELREKKRQGHREFLGSRQSCFASRTVSTLVSSLLFYTELNVNERKNSKNSSVIDPRVLCV